MFSLSALVVIALLSRTQAHGSNAHEDQKPMVPIEADWATKHMAEEHMIDSFDAGSFFNLHDYDGSNDWSPEEIMKTYGLEHESNRHVSQAEKDAAVAKVVKLFDNDHSGTISFAEFTVGSAKGIKLPDLGHGTGHHGDDEYEYEVHHFQKYHDENSQLEDLVHPEDIDHFRKHEILEQEQERVEKLDRMPIVEANIPAKFRRST